MNSQSRKQIHVCLIIFGVALAIRLFLLFGMQRYEIGRTETIRIAQRAKLKQALAWITTHRRQYLRLSFRRFGRFWFPAAPRFQWAFRGVAVFAAGGWLLLRRRARLQAGFIGMVLLLESASYAPFQTTIRYQHPIWWVLVLLSASMVYTLILPVTGRRITDKKGRPAVHV